MIHVYNSCNNAKIGAGRSRAPVGTVVCRVYRERRAFNGRTYPFDVFRWFAPGEKPYGAPCCKLTGRGWADLGAGEEGGGAA